MLTIDLGVLEHYNDESNTFDEEIGGVVNFEYSLKAIYDWEGKWKIPFKPEDLSVEQILDFYLHMADRPFNPRFITTQIAKQLANYITSTNTATTFSKLEGQNGNKGPSKLTTAEEIYAEMFSANIPLDFENRNLNRLMTILRVMSAKNAPPKKMSREDVLRQNASLNAQRKAAMKTKG